jgi:uncharacterized protein YbaA (DUF1428 family)
MPLIGAMNLPSEVRDRGALVASFSLRKVEQNDRVALECNGVGRRSDLGGRVGRYDFFGVMSERLAVARPLGANNPKEDVMSYVDGFVIAVPKDKIDAYKAMAQLGGKVWMEYGALSYVETLGDDTPYGELTSFPRAVQATDDEIVVFSWITYKDKASRDEIMAKVMADERLKSSMENMPFDAKRMIFGGFEAFLEL